jgi:Bacterial nucleoid DNA-binding protein
MPQGYYARKITLQTGVRKGETVYAVQPHYFGTLTTEDMADQIASESAMTKGDVKNVMEGMQRYIRSSLAKGYKVELLGFGLMCNRFKTSGSVDTLDKVSASLIKGIIPGFDARPSR